MIRLFNTYLGRIAVAISVVFLFLIFRGSDYLHFSPGGQDFLIRLQDFITLMLGIIVEAFPFVVLGVLVSVIVALYFKAEWIVKILPQNRFLSHILISLLGVFMPVCECGNIPVARRMMLKGFSASQSLTFLLAAPIINPVTYISTAEAFSFDPSVVVIRMLAAFAIANGVGILFSYIKKPEEILTAEFYAAVCEHDHAHAHSRLNEALDIFRTEFIEVMKMLIIGAGLAAISQSFIPRDVIIAIGQNPFLSVIAMIVLAFVISICSNVDAFFALSYASTFTIGSILSFLIFGPMIDIKILTMMRGTFKFKYLMLITLIVLLANISVGLLVNYLT
jgi:uncharacterized protein